MDTGLTENRDSALESTVSARVPVALKDRILQIAEQEDRSEGYVVRRLLKAALGLDGTRPNGNDDDQQMTAVA